jgi:hypothetical protein
MAMNNFRRLIAGRPNAPVWGIVSTIISTHLSVPALILTAASVVLLAIRRRRQALIGITWMLCVITGTVVFAGVTEPARYSFGAMPAYFLMIAALIREAQSQNTKILAAGLLSATLVWQVWTTRHVQPAGARGYEEAAEYVLANNHEPAMLFDGFVDTGYFVFFMRKHDPARQQIVLRAEKLLGWQLDDPEQDRVRMYEQLDRLGIRWIVVEERLRGPENKLAFYQQLRTSRFVERKRIPVISTVERNMTIVIYEYLDAKRADLDAPLNISLPLGRRNYSIRLRDLIRSER